MGEEGKAFGFECFVRVEMNGEPNVANETQDRMLSVIEDLGYTTNLAGLIMPDITYPLAAEIMQGVNRAIAESKIYPLIYTTDDVRKRGIALINPRCLDASIVNDSLQEHDRRCKQPVESFFTQKSGTIISKHNSCHKRRP